MWFVELVKEAYISASMSRLQDTNTNVACALILIDHHIKIVHE